MQGNAESSRPYVDIDEWRHEPRQHRYLHGGFEGTQTKFSLYFPPSEHYSGRFIQYLEGGAGGHEMLLATGGYHPASGIAWLFDLAFDELGAYLVESNQGHVTGEGTGFADDYQLFGASAQTALFGRQLAAQMYGSEPHHGYIWGVSGGGARSGQCLENRPDVWQGGVPHAGVGHWTQWSAWALAWLIARKKFPQIIDAMEPGGSGTPFAGLSHAEREAVAELYRRGYPRGAENQLAPFAPWAFPMYNLMDEDPEYFRDFWNEAGYQGADDPQSLLPLVVSEKTTVRRVVPASQLTNMAAQMHVRFSTAGATGSDPSWGVALDLDLDDPDTLLMSKVTMLSGTAAGRELLICGVEGDVLTPFNERTPEVFDGVQPGDEVQVDNRNFLAFCHYHRHDVADSGSGPGQIAAELQPWAVDGCAVYPQRPTRPSPKAMRSEYPTRYLGDAAPARYTGQLASKMIYVQPTLDAQVWNTTIFPYERKVREQLGDRADEQFRLWFVENAAHGAPEFLGPALTPEKDPGVWSSRLVSYDGVTAQALRDVVRWVEDGVPPRSYHSYHLDRDNALRLPAGAIQRGGVQPVVSTQANGGIRADVKVGENVTFVAWAEQPPGAGTIVLAEWDFEGRGRWERTHHEIDGSAPRIGVTETYAYNEPGTYFPSFRVAARCDGLQGRGPAIFNLARTRVVVSGS